MKLKQLMENDDATTNPSIDARGMWPVITYVQEVLKHRWPNGEKWLLKNLSFTFNDALQYVKTIIGYRWPELEQKILDDSTNIQPNRRAKLAMQYADQILGHRWLKAEHFIKEQPACWNEYKKLFHMDDNQQLGSL